MRNRTINSNSNTTTNAKKSQTLIFVEDGDNEILVFFITISRGVGKPEKWMQGVCKHGFGLSLTCK